MNIEKFIYNFNGDWSRVVNFNVTDETIYQTYQLIKENYDMYLEDFLKYVVSNDRYGGEKNRVYIEKYIDMCIDFIPYMEDPEWLFYFGNYLTNVNHIREGHCLYSQNDNEVFAKAAYQAFLKGSLIYFDEETLGYETDFAIYENITCCHIELGKCYYYGVGVAKNIFKAIDILHNYVGSISESSLTFREFYTFIKNGYEEIKNVSALNSLYKFSTWCHVNYDEETSKRFKNIIMTINRFGDNIARDIYQRALEAEEDYSKEKWFVALKNYIDKIGE